MISSDAPKVADIDEEDNILRTRARLTKNEYYATIRNKLEQNRLQVLRRYLDDEKDLRRCRIRTSIHDVKKDWNEQKTSICHLAEFDQSRKVFKINSKEKTEFFFH